MIIKRKKYPKKTNNDVNLIINNTQNKIIHSFICSLVYLILSHHLKIINKTLKDFYNDRKIQFSFLKRNFPACGLSIALVLSERERKRKQDKKCTLLRKKHNVNKEMPVIERDVESLELFRVDCNPDSHDYSYILPDYWIIKKKKNEKLIDGSCESIVVGIRHLCSEIIRLTLG